MVMTVNAEYFNLNLAPAVQSFSVFAVSQRGFFSFKGEYDMSGTETGTQRELAITAQMNELGKAVSIFDDVIAQLRNRLAFVSRPVEASQPTGGTEEIQAVSCPLSVDIATYVKKLNLHIGAIRETIEYLEV